jgi:hypothetical protein
MKFTFSGELWRWQGDAPVVWSFVTVPPNLALELRELGKFGGNGWGMIPVQAQIGNTAWKTSLFPQTKDKTYLLPIKASVRKAEKLKTGNVLHIRLEVMKTT